MMQRSNSEILDSPLPHSTDTEADELACILLDPAVMPRAVEAGLSQSHFLDSIYADIARGMITLHAGGKPPEIKLLVPWLQAHTKIEFPSVVLAEIIRRQAIGASWPHYLEILTELRLKREARLLGEQIVIHASNGQAGDSVISMAREGLDRIEAQRSKAIQPVTFGTLANENPRLPQPIIKGLLRVGETMNVVSESKVGKSWLNNNLGLCIVTGREFLGSFECEPGPVLLIDNELHPAVIAFRIHTVATALGIPPGEYRDNLHVLSLRGRLSDLYGVTRLLDGIKPGTYRAILFDAFYRGIPAGTSENDNAGVMALYNHIDATAKRLDCSWLNIHHSSKGAQGEKRVTDVGSGAGAQSRAADAHVVLRAHEEPGCVVMEAVMRSFPPIEPLALRWQFPLWIPADDLDPGKLKGKMTATEQRQSARDNEGIVKLATAFEQGPATMRELRGRTGLSKGRCERLLDSLESQGSIKWSETTVRGNACRVYESINIETEYEHRSAPF